MKKILLAFMALSISTTAFSEVKIGFVDMQKALEMTKKGKKAIKQLKKIQSKKQKDLDKKKKSLEAEQKELEKKFAVYSEEKKIKAQQEFQKKAFEAQKYFQQAQIELAQKEKQLLEPVYKGLRATVDKYAKEAGYQMVFEKNGGALLFGSESVEITKEVVKKFGK